MSDAMKATARRFFDQVLNAGDVAAIDGLLTEGFVEHEEAPGSPGNGREAVAWFVEHFRGAVPDLRVEIDDMIAEGDRLAVRSTWSGTQQGSMFGMPGTGRPFRMTVIDIVRFDGDRVGEHWGVSDVVGMMAQTGLLPA